MGINIQDVSFTYNKKTGFLFDNLNLQIASTDEFITIIGTTGSGKSTLAQLLNALLLPTKGNIYINDYKIKPKNNKNLKNVRKDVGFVFQFPEYQLFEDTVLKDVMFGPLNFKVKYGQAKEQAMSALKELNFKDSLINRSPFTLSGGEKRLASIAGTLAINPNIIIFDEPTVGLDYKAKEDLLSIIEKLNKVEHKTVIFITHDMDVVAKYAKRVIVLNNGNVSFDGTKEDLFNNSQLLFDNNLSVPYISKIAIELKKLGLINYDQIPLTVDELEKIIRGGRNE